MSQVAQVKEATDIVAIIGERLQLQRSGNYFKVPCPFHSEKTPSFFVNEVMQRYKCFGCGKHGDALQFLQDYEGMTFGEALQYLADRAGITLESFKHSPQDTQREQILAVLDLAREYFHYLLTEHASGQVARDYLKDRQISAESIKVFQLGYSTAGWEGLISFLHKKKKYSLELLEDAGLVIKGRQGYYDRFRDRVMFPLKNHRGQVVGFSGRSLNPEAKEAKYINSPETSVYHKSELLYGYSELFQAIRKQKQVLVVEGEMDVISSAQAHVNHVVAVKGSSFTKEQAKLLSRSVETVVLALDADSAGQEATRRAIEVAQEFDLDLRVLSLGNNGEVKDPDDLARANPKQWRELSKKTVSVYDFLIDLAISSHDLGTARGQRKVLEDVGPVLEKLHHAVEKDFYLKKLAQKLKVSEKIIKDDLRTIKLKPAPGGGAARKTAATQNDRTTAKPKPQKNTPEARRQRLERYMLFLLAQASVSKWSEWLAQLQEFAWHSDGFKSLLDRLTKIVEKGKATDVKGILSQLDGDLQQLFFESTVDNDWLELSEKLSNTHDLDKEWDKALDELRGSSARDQINIITKELDQLDSIDDKTPEQEQRQQELLQEIVKLKR